MICHSILPLNERYLGAGELPSFNECPDFDEDVEPHKQHKHKVTTAVHLHDRWTLQTIEELWNMFAIYHYWCQGHLPNTQFFGKTHVDFSADNLYAGKFKRN